jgi:flagellin
MGLRINQNIAAMNAYRNLTVTDGQMAKSLEKLSSGFRINRAADDAAGLSISEGLRAQAGGTKTAIRNAQDGISVVQTAEGALSEVHSILQRMRDLAVQAANTGSQDANAVTAAQTELNELNNEINRIGNTTSFGNTKLLDGSFGQQQSLTGAAAAWANKTVAAGNDEFALTYRNETTGTDRTVTVTVTQATYTSGASLAGEFNRAISTAIKADGGTGTEVSVGYDVKSDGTGGFFKMSGLKAFTVADGADATNAAETHLGAAILGASAASGTGGVFQVGANNSSNDRITVSLSAVNTTSLSTASLNVTTAAGAQSAISALDSAISSVSTTRATLGAYQNRFEHTISNLSVASENLSASESRIRDTDMAQEMVQFTRANILTQAGTAMLAQANQAPQQVLQLLRG